MGMQEISMLVAAQLWRIELKNGMCLMVFFQKKLIKKQLSEKF